MKLAISVTRVKSETLVPHLCSNYSQQLPTIARKIAYNNSTVASDSALHCLLICTHDQLSGPPTPLSLRSTSRTSFGAIGSTPHQMISSTYSTEVYSTSSAERSRPMLCEFFQRIHSHCCTSRFPGRVT